MAAVKGDHQEKNAFFNGGALGSRYDSADVW
jgi:hypothetical protein